MLKYLIIFGLLSTGGLYWYGARGTGVIEDPVDLPATEAVPIKPAEPPKPPPPPRLTQKETDEIRTSLFDSNVNVRIEALNKLVRFAGDDVDEMLLTQLKIDSDASMRMRVLGALETRDPGKAPEMIRVGLRDTEPSVRIAAIHSLRNIRDYTAMRPISGLLYDVEVDVRREAIDALNFLASRKVTKRYIEGKAAEYVPPENFQVLYQRALTHARSGGK